MRFLILFIFTVSFSYVFSQNVSFTMDVNEGCAPLTVNCTNTSTIGAGYGWFSSDGEQIISTDFSHTFTTPGEYIIFLLAADSTGNVIETYEENVWVHGTSFSIAEGTTVCPGQKLHFEAMDDYYWLYWDFGFGPTEYDNWSVARVFQIPGTYTISLVAEGDCGLDTMTQTVTVTPAAIPMVEAFLNGDTYNCMGDEVFFEAPYQAETYLWDFDDGSTSTKRNPRHVYTGLGSKMVTLTVTNLCGNVAVDTVQVYIQNDVEADANFFVYPEPACPGQLVGFYGWGNGQFLWDFGDGGTSSAREPRYLFADTGAYNVNLTVVNGCGLSATTEQVVNIQADPTKKPEVQTYFSWGDYWDEDTVTVCPGEEVRIKNYAWDENNLVFRWDMGDDSIFFDRDVVHAYQTPGLYEVTLVATNNCLGSDTSYLWVNVDDQALPSVMLQNLPNTICPGDKVYFFDEGNYIPLSAYVYSVWFGDGDSLINQTEYNDEHVPTISHEYTTPGTYDFIFQAINLCGNNVTLTGQINVQTDPDVEAFYYIDNSTVGDGGLESNGPGCPGDSVAFTIAGGISYEWFFGDGESSMLQSPKHAYQDTGVYDVYCIATNGCGRIDTVESVAYIADTVLPKVWFDISHDVVCAGEAVRFEYPESPLAANSYGFLWDFGDGFTSNEQNPTHAYTEGGDYFVKLVLSNGCGSDSIFRHVMVANPVISFSSDLTAVQPGEQIQFNNQVVGGISFLWDFGDGTTSTQPNPTHSYTEYGIYDVSLSSSSMLGCATTDTIHNMIFVHNIQIAQAALYNPKCSGGSSGHIDIAITGGKPPYSYIWSTGSSNQDVHNIPAGAYTVTITDADGLILSETFYLDNPEPIEVDVYTDDEYCGHDGYIELDVWGGTGPYNVAWSNGESGMILENLTSGYYPGTITDAEGCSMSSVVLIEDMLDPLVLTGSYSDATCNTTDGIAWVTVSGGSGSYSYEWDDDLGSTTVSISGLEAGVYTVYVSDDQWGCYDSTFSVVANPTGPTITSMASEPASCNGGSNGMVGVIATGVAPLTYEWSTEPPQYTQVVNGLTAGYYSVTITDDNGCMFPWYIEVTQPEVLDLRLEISDPECYGAYNGNATVFIENADTLREYYYHWSNGSEDELIQNRNAGTYYLTITDNMGCQTMETVVLQNPDPVEIDVFTSDVTFHGASDGVIDINIVSGFAPFSYDWADGASTQDRYQLDAGIYEGTVTDSHGCTTSGSIVINEPAALNVEITANGPTTFCYGGNITLDAGSGYAHYLWSTGETTQSIIADTTKTYYVMAANDTSYGIDSISILSTVPYNQQDLCLVTVDNATGKNLVIWEKTQNEGIVAYNIYKESNSAGQYQLIGTVPNDSLSVFLDNTSNPAQQSDRYRISVTDTCGNESDLSDAHKTMHLTVSTGVGVYNLIWENYEGFDFGSYLIYRGTSQNNLQPIGIIQSNLTTYTDYQPQGLYYYQIAVLKNDTCLNTGGLKASGGPYSHSYSNLDDNGVAVQPLAPDFSSDYTSVYIGASVNFYSESSGSISSYHWTFEGGIPASYTGETPPPVRYDSVGTYDVTLSITDGADTAIVIKPGYISVSYNTELGVQFLASPRYFTQPPFNVAFENQTPAGSAYNYTWYFGDGQSSNSFQPFHTYQDTGLYSVMLIAEDPISGTIDTALQTDYIYCINNTGIESIFSDILELKIYPNPFTERTTIEFPNPEMSEYKIVIRDIGGKVVTFFDNVQGEKIVLDRGGLNKGIYFIEVSGNKNYKGRMVIN